MEGREEQKAATRMPGIPASSGPAALTTAMGVVALVLAASTIAASAAGIGNPDLLLLFTGMAAGTFLILRRHVRVPEAQPDTLIKDTD